MTLTTPLHFCPQDLMSGIHQLDLVMIVSVEDETRINVFSIGLLLENMTHMFKLLNYCSTERF